MANSDNSWVFDSLICFLNGPLWNVPIQSFIEEKCSEFEPTIANEKERQKIHTDFKNLVDLLLGTYMEDICITTEQFEIACNQLIQENYSSLFKQNIFEQIWAANDYDLFEQMMIEKNLELQKQALELNKKKKPKKTVSIVEPAKPDIKYDEIHEVKDIPDSEKNVMTELLHKLESIELPDDDIELKELKERKTDDEKSLQINDEKLKTNSPTHGGTVIQSVATVHQVSEEDIKKRQEYLKMQRDKLVALKKQVRQKHLQDEIKNSDTAKTRPKSAKVAEAALNGNIQIKPDVLQFRKTLAEKLKSEVVKK